MGKNRNKQTKGATSKTNKRVGDFSISLEIEEGECHTNKRKVQETKKPKYKEASDESEVGSEYGEDFSSDKKDLEESEESENEYSQDYEEDEEDDDDSLMTQSDLNEDFCFYCKDEGKLICCDNCFKAFHLVCLNLKKTPNGKWECPFCDESKKDVCSKCNKVRKEEDLRLTCSLCYKMTHFNCAKTPLELILDSPLNENFFNDQTIIDILKSFKSSEITFQTNNKKVWVKDHKNPKKEDLYKMSLKLNKNLKCFYQCDECIMRNSVENTLDHVTVKKTLLNASGLPNSEDNEDYFFVKPEHSSYIHSLWCKGSLLEIKNKKKLKNFIEKNLEEEEETKEDNDNVEHNDKGEKIVDDLFDPDYCKIDRVLACKKPYIQKTKNTKYQTIYDQVFGSNNKGNDLNEKFLNYGAKNNYKYLVKWENLTYDKCTWEDEYIVNRFKSKLKKFYEIKIKEEQLVLNGKSKNNSKIGNDKNQNKHQNMNIDPENEKRLYEFQQKGVRWLIQSWNDKNNVMLADEMGLGKTIQTLSLLNFLCEKQQIEGPFLVVAPATTLLNWQKECNVWVPALNSVVYIGNQDSREIIRKKEFFFNKAATLAGSKGVDKRGKTLTNLKTITKFNILITSYEMAMQEYKFLKKIAWEVMIIDEAHRLKNNESKLFKISIEYSTKFKILLTGTPLQNNIMELMNLIEFISPEKAKYLKNIETLKIFLDIKHNNINDKQMNSLQNINETERQKALNELTKVLAPHILRRTKDEVKIQLPEFEEIIVKVSLTEKQKFYYKNILLKNYEFLRSLDTKAKYPPRVSLLNLLNNLRLVCNHPNLFLFRRDFQIPKKDKFREEFIESSNKLKLVERLIKKLLESNHKILLFSQYTMMLDIMEVFLKYKEWSYERLDGQTKIIERQKIIDDFNSNTSRNKIFLLSTRAGGLGINLTSADTIIFTDSDYNPYRDIQAISRAHRIGQKNKVKVLRIVSKYTAEEKIIEIATKKLLLEEIVINPISKFSKDDLEAMLKSGTIHLFNKNLEEKETEFTDEQIEALLNRDHEGEEKNMEMEKEGEITKGKLFVRKDLNDYYLSGFKFQSLSFQSYNDNAEKQKDIEDKNKYWEGLLSTDAQVFQEHEYNELGKGKRVRKLLTNTFNQNSSEDEGDDSSYEVSEKNTHEISEGHSLVHESFEKNDKNLKLSKRRDLEKMEKKKEMEKIIAECFESMLKGNQIKELNNLTKEKKTETVVYGFDEVLRSEFLLFTLSYGLYYETLEQLWKELSKVKSCFGYDKNSNKIQDFKNYVRDFYYVLCYYETFPNNIIFCGLDAELVFKRILGLMYLRKKYCYFAKRPTFFKITHKDYLKNTPILSENPNMNLREIWTNLDDFLLIKGIIVHGYDNWKTILEDRPLWCETPNFQYEPYKIIFNKIEKSDFSTMIIDENDAKSYVSYFLCCRANNLLSYLLERETIREDYSRKKKDNLSESIQELKNP